MRRVIRIKSLAPGGHFRAGRLHGPEEKTWPAEMFTSAQLELLRNDPRLEIREEEIAAPEGSAPPVPAKVEKPKPKTAKPNKAKA